MSRPPTDTRTINSTLRSDSVYVRRARVLSTELFSTTLDELATTQLCCRLYRGWLMYADQEKLPSVLSTFRWIFFGSREELSMEYSQVIAPSVLGWDLTPKSKYTLEIYGNSTERGKSYQCMCTGENRLLSLFSWLPPPRRSLYVYWRAGEFFFASSLLICLSTAGRGRRAQLI